MKTYFAPLGACLFITLAGVQADTIRLKNGSRMEGKILSETTETVTIETGTSIKEVHEVSRTDIVAVDKETPDEAAYKKLAALVPTADLLTAAEYRTMMGGELAAFPLRFKDSKHTEDVEKIAATLKEEQAKVEAGGVKVNGKWVTGEEAAADTYNHRARIEAAKLKKAAAAGDFAVALGHFETIEEELRYSKAFERAVGQATDLLPKYDAVLKRMELENAALMKAREENLRGMDADRRKQTEDAFEKQMAAFQARRVAEKEAGRTWQAVSKYDAPSISEARATVATEIGRLSVLDLSKQTSTANLVATVYQKLAADDLAAAASAMSAATVAGATDPTLDALKAKIETEVKETEAERTAAAEAEEARKMAELAAAPAVSDGAANQKPEEPKTPRQIRFAEAEAKRKAAEEAAAAEAAANPGESSGSSAAADDDGGFPLSKLLIILAVVLIIVTILAKKFAKPSDDE